MIGGDDYFGWRIAWIELMMATEVYNLGCLVYLSVATRFTLVFKEPSFSAGDWA
jgi:hypothetical protein